EDLSVPTIRPANRGHPSPDPHPGIERRGCDPDDCDAGRIRRGHPLSADGSGSCASRRQRGPRARRYQVQLRSISVANASGVRSPHREIDAAGCGGRRVTAARSSRADHYSYSVYADAATAEAFDALRFGGPIGRLVAETQQRVIASFLAPVSGRTVLDVGTGT